MKLDVGTSIPIQCIQLAVLTGHPSDEIKDGHSFAWGKGMFQVESIHGDEAIIRRLASHEIKALDQTKVLNPSQFQELDVWQNPGTQLENPMTPKQTGAFTDSTKRDFAGGDVVPKDQVFPRELKTKRPGFREPMPLDTEPRDPSIRMSAIESPIYQQLKMIEDLLNDAASDNSIMNEAMHGASEQSLVEFAERLQNISRQCMSILGNMEKVRDLQMRQRGINPNT